MEKANRNYSLDFLKILAAIGIVFHHFQSITGVRYDNFINFYGSWFEWGLLVEFFFILSGYFMYRYVNVIKSGGVTLFEWWKKRAVRLIPMAAITVVFFEIVLLIHNSFFTPNLWGLKPSLWEAVTAMLCVQEGWGFPNPIINNSIWYISSLMFCYVLFYIVTALSEKLKCNPIYFYVATVFIGIGVRNYGIDLPFLNWQMSRGYYAFFFGLLLSAYLSNQTISKKHVIGSLSVIAFCIVAFIFAHQYVIPHLNFVLTFLFYPALVILFETKPVRSVFRHKIWGTVSAISFEVYLWHLPLLLLLYLVARAASWVPDFANMGGMLIFTVATWGVASLMYFFVERPITNLLTKNKKQQEVAKETA